MKKLLFSAMACIAFSGSAFASNEVVKEAQLLEVETKDSPDKVEFESECRANFSGTNPEGIPDVITFVKHGLTSDGCDEFLKQQTEVLNKRGWIIKKKDNTYKAYDETIGRP